MCLYSSFMHLVKGIPSDLQDLVSPWNLASLHSLTGKSTAEVNLAVLLQ